MRARGWKNFQKLISGEWQLGTIEFVNSVRCTSLAEAAVNYHSKVHMLMMSNTFDMNLCES